MMDRLTEKIIDKNTKEVVLYRIKHKKTCEAVGKLGELEDLEECGRLLKFNCAPGDTVYEVQKERNRIQPYEIISVIVDRTGYRYYNWELSGKGIYSNIKGFGDSRMGIDIFLTKEEAESKLREINEARDK